jgi:hypothetical protein
MALAKRLVDQIDQGTGTAVERQDGGGADAERDTDIGLAQPCFQSDRRRRTVQSGLDCAMNRLMH